MSPQCRGDASTRTRLLRRAGLAMTKYNKEQHGAIEVFIR